MQESEFDELIRKQFDDYEFEYKRSRWERLLASLAPMQYRTPARHRWLPVVTGIAAAMATLIAVGAWHYYQAPAIKDQTRVAMQRTMAPLRTIHDMPELPVQQAFPTALPIQTPAFFGNHHHRPAHLPGAIVQPAVNPAALVFQPDISANAEPDIVLLSSGKPLAKPTQTSLSAMVTAHQYSGSVSGVMQTIARSPNPSTHIVVVDGVILPEKPNAYFPKGTNISLAGGVNYGTLNGGYTAGLNARHHLGRWYVESDVAFVNYDAAGATNVSNNTLAVLVNNTNNVNGAMIASRSREAPEPQEHVQYLQASPGIGYHLFKKITIGANADIQRMLQQNSNNTVQVSDDAVKLFPLTDYGIAGKAEVSVTSKLNAGIIYRQGMNNLLSAGTDYLDRRYLQVQLKYRLIGK